MIQPAALDPLALPLHGRQVIEASAGTGKTWTLSALYLRLVLGLRDPIQPQSALGVPLLPPQILVMTFTEAATAERTRVLDALTAAVEGDFGWERRSANSVNRETIIAAIEAQRPKGEQPMRFTPEGTLEETP